MSTDGNSNFPCTQCGACCIMAGKLGLMPAGESGACKYLGPDMLCTIYETRPEICRVDAMRKKYGLSREDFYPKVATACNLLQETLGINESFRVELN